MQKIFDITDKDFEKIEKSIYDHGLSYYNLQKKDFICYKVENNIVAYARIYNIWEQNYELSCIFVDDDFRQKGLWRSVILDCIQNKFSKEKSLYLACEQEMEEFYEKSGFQKVQTYIPEKLEYTLKWAKENNMDAIIMKYIRN